MLQTQVLFDTTTDQIATTWHTTLIGGRVHPGCTGGFHVDQNKIPVFLYTPPKTNMEIENGPLEKEIPFGNHPFQVPC